MGIKENFPETNSGNENKRNRKLGKECKYERRTNKGKNPKIGKWKEKDEKKERGKRRRKKRVGGESIEEAKEMSWMKRRKEGEKTIH